MIRPLIARLREMLAAMEAKDPALRAEVGHMPVGEAWRRWKSVHPEDFPDGGQTAVGPDAIRPRPTLDEQRKPA